MNMALSEWREARDKAAARSGGTSTKYGISWVPAIGDATFELVLDLETKGHYMAPFLRIESVATGPTDPGMALATYLNRVDVLKLGMAAFETLRRARVFDCFPSEVPCDTCWTENKYYRVSCEPCRGTGLRDRRVAS